MTNVKFLHLHKTAGTSVRMFLTGFFRPHEVCPAITHQELSALQVERLRGYRLFAGHFDWAKLDEVEGPSFTFTVLRDPVERVVSNYFFWRALARRSSAKDRNLPHVRLALDSAPDDFFAGTWMPRVRKFLDDQDNLYTRYFAGRGFASRQRLAIRRMSDCDLLSEAHRNLDRLDGLYATDDLGRLKKDVLAVLGRRRGDWRSVRARLYPLRLIKRNQTVGHLNSRLAELESLGATHRTFDRIDDMTRLDRILWTERFQRPATPAVIRTP
jgi:hypothetical protein